MVYIKKLNKHIFPNYIKPFDDELFSSWLCRLSFSHDIKPLSFIQNYFGREYPIWNRDIDMLAPSFLIHKILKHTPLNISEVNNLFLTSYEMKAYHKRNYKGVTDHIIPLGIKHRKRKRYGQLFCSGCLTEKIAYYRKSWRLLTSFVCVKCNLYLKDRCPRCKSPITFFRLNMSLISISVIDHKELCFCSECGHDLRSDIERIEEPTKRETAWQCLVNETIENGYNVFTPYSFLFFKGVFLLVKRLRSNTKNNLFRLIVEKELNMVLPILKGDLRFWTIDDRRETFYLIYLLLEEYPNKLNRVFERGGITMTKIYGERERIPYWLEYNIIYQDKKSNFINPC